MVATHPARTGGSAADNDAACCRRARGTRRDGRLDLGRDLGSAAPASPRPAATIAGTSTSCNAGTICGALPSTTTATAATGAGSRWPTRACSPAAPIGWLWAGGCEFQTSRLRFQTLSGSLWSRRATRCPPSPGMSTGTSRTGAGSGMRTGPSWKTPTNSWSAFSSSSPMDRRPVRQVKATIARSLLNGGISGPGNTDETASTPGVGGPADPRREAYRCQPANRRAAADQSARIRRTNGSRRARSRRTSRSQRAPRSRALGREPGVDAPDSRDPYEGVVLGLGAVGSLLAAAVIAGLGLRRRTQLQARPLGRRIVSVPEPARRAESVLGRKQRPLNLRALDLATRGISAYCHRRPASAARAAGGDRQRRADRVRHVRAGAGPAARIHGGGQPLATRPRRSRPGTDDSGDRGGRPAVSRPRFARSGRSTVGNCWSIWRELVCWP